jgi:putative aldouronate transport system substrate-binding protein
MKFFEESPDIYKLLRAPDGHIYNVCEVFKGGNKVSIESFILRMDWVKKLGLNTPETIDDWYTVFKAFREKDPNGNGSRDEIPLVSSFGIQEYNRFGTAFGMPAPVPQFWANSQGKVEFMPIKGEYKQLLTFLNKLYSEQLINPELTFKGDLSRTEALVARDVMGCSVHFTSTAVKYETILKNSGKTSEYQLIPSPVGPDGKRPMVLRNPLGMQYGVARSSKNAETAVKWIDYIWANPQGWTLAMYGVQGLSYDVDAGGRPRFTDFVTANPKGLTTYDALRSIGAFPPFLTNRKQEYMEQMVTARDKAANAALLPHLVDPFPAVLPTKAENERIMSLTPDINTYLDENLQKFITGAEPLANFDKFVAQLKKMGIDELVGIQQARYDRFMSK